MPRSRSRAHQRRRNSRTHSTASGGASVTSFGSLRAPASPPRSRRRRAREGTNGLVLVFFEATRAFADEDLELARHLADAARGALERSELFEAERTARRLSQQLARTGGVLATELDPTAVLDEVVHQAPELLGAAPCAIWAVEGAEPC